MRLRAYVAAASIAAGLWLSAGNARAQGAAPPAPDQAPDIVGVEQFFSAPSALGDAWARVVHAALDGVRDLLQADGATARAALAPAPKPRAPAWQAPIPARREAPKARRAVAFQPVTFAPPARAVADSRGESATLLGVAFALPWSVP